MGARMGLHPVVLENLAILVWIEFVPMFLSDTAVLEVVWSRESMRIWLNKAIFVLIPYK